VHEDHLDLLPHLRSVFCFSFFGGRRHGCDRDDSERSVAAICLFEEANRDVSEKKGGAEIALPAGA
jgi:hypothetical protein